MARRLSPPEIAERKAGPVKDLFGPRQQYLVLPRLEMQEMSLEWQQRMAALVQEMNDAGMLQHGANYSVVRRGKKGRAIHDPWAKFMLSTCEKAAEEEQVLKDNDYV